MWPKENLIERTTRRNVREVPKIDVSVKTSETEPTAEMRRKALRLFCRAPRELLTGQRFTVDALPRGSILRHRRKLVCATDGDSAKGG